MSRRTLQRALLVAATALLVQFCREAHAAIAGEEPHLALLPGDTLHFSAQGSVFGLPDSVRVTVTSTNAKVPAPVPRKWSAPYTNPLLYAVNILPSPALAAGESVTMIACWQGWSGGQALVAAQGSCRSANYTRPGVTGDTTVISLEIVPDSVRAYMNDTVTMTAVITYGDGRIGLSPVRTWVGLKPGLIPVTASAGGKTASAVIAVGRGGRNEPAGYTAFAWHDGSSLPPQQKTIYHTPGVEGQWRAVADPDLTLVADSSVLPRTLP